MEQRRARSFNEKQKDREEGEEYRRLAQQNALELLEVEQFKKQNQKTVKSMYDKAMEDKQKVKQMEQELDEVLSSFSSCGMSSLLICRKKMRIFVCMLKQRRRWHVYVVRKNFKCIGIRTTIESI